MRPDWNGIYPALTTKLTTDDKLDIPLFLKTLKHKSMQEYMDVLLRVVWEKLVPYLKKKKYHY